MEFAEIENRFKYHALDVGRQAVCANMRAAAWSLANLINRECPESREKSLAITKLEESLMWANAAVARTERAETARVQPDEVRAAGHGPTS